MKKIVIILILLSVWACDTVNQRERINERQLKRLIRQGTKVEPMDGKYNIEFDSVRKYNLILKETFNDKLQKWELTGYFEDSIDIRNKKVYPIKEGHFCFDYYNDEYKVKFMADVEGYNLFVGEVEFLKRQDFLKNSKYPHQIFGTCWEIEDSLKEHLDYNYDNSEFWIKVFDCTDSSYSFKRIEYKSTGKWKAIKR